MIILDANTNGKFAVIFTARLTKQLEGYDDAVSLLRNKLNGHEGFIGLESVADADGNEITISYWESEASIKRWKLDEDHQAIRYKHRTHWYRSFKVRIAQISREYKM